MSRHDEENKTPPSAVHAVRGTISLDDRLTNIERLLAEIKDGHDSVRDELGVGSRQFALLNLRTRALEIIVYGGCAIALISILTAILFLVVKQVPAATADTSVKITP